MLVNNIHLTEIKAPKQTIKARVELHKGSTLERICNCNDILAEMAIEKTGEGKFFGFGICQKLRASLIDLERDLTITKEHSIEAAFGVKSDYIYPFPRFYVQEVERDESTNLINVVAYDILYKAERFKVDDLGLPPTYTLKMFAAACAGILGVPMRFINIDESTFDTYYPEGGNFEGTESVRTALNALAEATQTIYYINRDWELVFHRLDQTAEPVYTIGRDEYIDLKSGENRVLTRITHATDLGDNTTTTGTDAGVTQFVRNNPFWELRDDIDVLLNKAKNNIVGLAINQFEASWFGNYLLEIGDRIAYVTEDNKTIETFVLDDTVLFDGTLMGSMRWVYDENEGETEANPITIGEAVSQTYARVDKVNKRIDLVVSDTDGKISSLQLTTDSITGIVADLEREVETKVSADGVEIAINKSISDGVNKVDTGTGFIFNEDGLTVQKIENDVVGEMKTTITEDGMTVYRNNDAVLTANNEGVNAENLHATTYLIVGGRSRFENYKSNRTGCFWIG